MVLQPCIPTEPTGHSSSTMKTVRLRQSHLTTPVSGMIFMTVKDGNRFGSLISHHNNHFVHITESVPVFLSLDAYVIPSLENVSKRDHSSLKINSSVIPWRFSFTKIIIF